MVFCDACPLIFENDLTILTRILTFIYTGLYVLLHKPLAIFGSFAGDSLQITDYSGDFKESRLNEAKEIVLIAAGTGV